MRGARSLNPSQCDSGLRGLLATVRKAMVVRIMTLRILLIVISMIAISCGNAFADASTRTMCSDGWVSPSTGSGTCSWHGGIAGGGSGGGYYTPPSGGSSGGSYVNPSLTHWTGRYFSSPSGNIQCRYEPGRQRVGCSSLSAGQTAWVSRRFYPWVTYSIISSRATSIPYGDYWAMGGFECWSLVSGMNCYSPQRADSFLVDRSGVSIY